MTPAQPPGGPEDGNHEIVEPRAGALVESLRAFGYSTEAAVADLVDNSISADASEITVHFLWAGDSSWVVVADNGRGMTEERLREAMRPGSVSPLQERRPEDLGRFGLGLKTASFSQCRRLTVMSATEPGRPATRTWDLDLVGRTGRWSLLTEERPEDLELWRRFNQDKRGTLVVWRQLDRLVEAGAGTGEAVERHFHRATDRVRTHLRDTFHRFLSGTGRISVRVNTRSLKPWDPFLEDNAATQVLGDESLYYRGERIPVRSLVLPHHTRLTGAEERRTNAVGGRSAQQGFHVYRNRRLIVDGGWLGLGFPREEPTGLVRIRLDLPNTMDDAWQIDVRKATARPPAQLVEQLRRIAEVARRASTQVYRHRGKVVERSGQGDLVCVWEQVRREERISYRVNRNHPLVVAARTRDDGRDVEALLRLVEEAVPVPLIVLDHSGDQTRQAEPFETDDTGALTDLLETMTHMLRRKGLSDEEIRARLSSTEPFSDHPQLVAGIGGRETP